MMKRTTLTVLTAVFLLFALFGSASAQKLMINPQEFYDKFCRIASETYGGRFCTSVLSSGSSGYTFSTIGSFTVTLKSTSASKDMSLATLKMPDSVSLQSKEARTAMYAHFLTADNNIFASESTFSILDDYVKSVGTRLGKELKYDRIRILSEKKGGYYLMQAYK